MTRLNLISFCFFALSFAATTIQVTVILDQEYDLDHSTSLTCRNLPPGHCCTAPFAIFASFSAHVVTFQDLNAWDIAAIWRGSTSASLVHHSAFEHGCNGEVSRSKIGPGSWIWEMRDEPVVRDYLTPATGASYIEIPRSLPVDGKTSRWLSVQGMLGLVWGDGNWFVTPHASKLLGYGNSVRPRSRLRRDIRSELKGTVYAGSPPQRVFPTVIEVNGSTYISDGIDDLAYKNELGKLLNLTELGNMLQKQGN